MQKMKVKNKIKRKSKLQKNKQETGFDIIDKAKTDKK